jgi:hypothetical protein
MTGMHDHIQLYRLRWASCFFTLLFLNHGPPNLYLLSCWDYRHEPLGLTSYEFLY